MVYIPECKQQLRATKSYAQMRDIAYFKSGLYFYYSQRAVQELTILHGFMLQIIYTNLRFAFECLTV